MFGTDAAGIIDDRWVCRILGPGPEPTGMDDETRGLWQVARHFEDAPGFMAYELARLRAAGQDPAAVLGADERQLVRLALCRTPRRDGRFVADVSAIATHVGMDADRLAAMWAQLAKPTR